jgi:hypothetical protein
MIISKCEISKCGDKVSLKIEKRDPLVLIQPPKIEKCMIRKYFVCVIRVKIEEVGSLKKASEGKEQEGS